MQSFIIIIDYNVIVISVNIIAISLFDHVVQPYLLRFALRASVDRRLSLIVNILVLCCWISSYRVTYAIFKPRAGVLGMCLCYKMIKFVQK